MNPKKGHTVRIIFDQINEEGDLISHSANDWHGFERKTANDFSIAALRNLLDLIERFAVAQAESSKQ